MATIQEQIAQAKSAGYSDEDIAKHLSSMQDFAPKVKQAQAAGYSASDIVSHLAQPSAPAAPEKGFGEQLSDTIKDVPRQIGLTARYGLEGLGNAVGDRKSVV